MRKAFTGAVVGLMFGAVSAVSALDFSVGGGGFFGSDFGGGADFNISVSSTVPLLGEIKVDIGNGTLKTPYYGGGARLFFDLTYAEVSVGYFMGGGTWTMDAKTAKTSLSSTLNLSNIIGNLLGIDIPEGGYSDSMEINSSFSSVNLGLLMKYPIAVSEAIIVFPAVGIDYQLCLSGKSKYDLGAMGSRDEDWGENAGSYNALFFKFGAGVDFSLSDGFFLRSELLYGVRLANKAEDELINTLKSGLGLDGLNLDDYITSKTRLGHGLTVKAGVGFKL